MIRARNAKLRKFLFICGLALLLVRPLPASPHQRVVDETGRVVEVPAHPQRIVSLAPNLTEILFALDLGERVVGVTDACDYPPAARQLPRVGSVVSPSLERIVSLGPDLVLATTAGNRRETVAALERLGVPVYATNPHSLLSTFASIEHIARLTGSEQPGRALVEALQHRLDDVRARTRGLPRPSVLFVVWFEPLITAGRNTFIQDAIHLAGGDSISGELHEDWPHLSLEEVIRRNPDIVVTAQGPGMEQRIREISGQAGWRELKAVRTGRLIVLDDKALRPSPRLVEVVEAMARAFHPEAFR